MPTGFLGLRNDRASVCHRIRTGKSRAHAATERRKLFSRNISHDPANLQSAVASRAAAVSAQLSRQDVSTRRVSKRLRATARFLFKRMPTGPAREIPNLD